MRPWFAVLFAASSAGVLVSCQEPFTAGPEDAAGGSTGDSPDADPGLDAGNDTDGGADADARGDATEAGSPPETTIDLTPSKDAYVEDGPSIDTNFGASAQLRVKGNSGGTLDRSTWVSFDVGGLSSISGATLRLWVVSLDTGNADPIPNEIFHAPTSSDGWVESTITWTGAPPFGPQVAQTTVTDQQLHSWVEVDVTEPVSTDSDGLVTFVISSPQYTGRGLTYSSREGAEKPVLRVTGIRN